MSNTGEMFINGWDVSLAGLIVESVSGWRPTGTMDDRGIQILNRYGSAPASSYAASQGASIIVQGTIEGTTVADVKAKVDLLRSKLFSGILELSFYNNTDKIAVCYCDKADVAGIEPQWIQPYQKIAIQFHSPVPVLFGAQPTVIGFTSTKAACPIGTGLSSPIIIIPGAVTNPTITYRDIRGNVVKTLVLTVTLADTDYLVVNCWKKTIQKSASGGALSDQIALLTGYFNFDALNPADADYENSAWPTLEISPTANASAQYRKVFI